MELSQTEVKHLSAVQAQEGPCSRCLASSPDPSEASVPPGARGH